MTAPEEAQAASLGLTQRLQRCIAIAAPRRHIFLLSHMRAYTSLFGHIMGSHPAICGYYEMHIGYHSWRSLVRQKLLYFEQEAPKPGFRYMFDKVLHSDHYVSPQLLDSARVRTIFSLRNPVDVLPSILSLYSRVDPGHDFNDPAFAARYYIDRLEMLEKIAGQMHSDFFYLDAEALKRRTDDCLAALGDWLHLSPPLSPNYVLQQKTAQQRYGDSSEQISSGKINRARSDYSSITIDESLLERATEVYQRVRGSLVTASSYRCTCTTADTGKAA